MDKKNARLIFMGTPDIARDCLSQLIEDGYNITAVFTREDKPVGRKQIMTAPPVKTVALDHGIPVYQPKTLKGETGDIIKGLQPDLIAVVAYGRILPANVIEMPTCGCLNLHVSLLPKYRGAAPIQWAVINGDNQTGVTVMHINEGLDTGDIVDVLPVEIGDDETADELFEDVAEKGKVFFSKVIEKVLSGNYTRTPQDDSKATFAPPLTKEMSRFELSDDVNVVYNKIRGQNPWPGTDFLCDGKKVKVIKARKSAKSGKPGEILSLKPLTVSLSGGSLEMLTVQPEGSKAMDGTAWARGRRFKIGDIIQ